MTDLTIDVAETLEDDNESDFSEGPEDTAGDLEKILSNAFKFDGNISFARAYPAAPNPCLQVDALGNVGLPLSSRDARAVIDASSPATLSDNGRTTVGAHTWETDAAKLHVDNPLWTSFMEGVVRDVCKTLNVDHEFHKPRSDLYKLLLCEPGSQLSSHVQADTQEGMFATIVVVLPSRFIGGVTSLSHGVLASSHDVSENSSSTTSVLAWYTGVTHAMAPVASGYRLALVYNLIQTTSRPRPRLVNFDENVVKQLRPVLAPWRRHAGEDDVPQQIIFLLKHQYKQETLHPRDLRGEDASMLAVLNMLGLELEYRVGFADIELQASGHAVVSGRHRQRRQRLAYQYGYSEDSGAVSVDPYDVDMKRVNDRLLSVENLASLDGVLYRSEIDIEEWDTVPKALAKSMEEKLRDEHEYDQDSKIVTHYYRRSALVIWPDDFHFTLAYGEDGSTAALDELRITRSPASTWHERRLIDHVFASQQLLAHEKCFPSIFQAACAWTDLRLWKRAMDMLVGGDSLAKLSAERVFEAVNAFGMGAVRHRFSALLKSEATNAARWQFLCALALQIPGGLRKAMDGWIKKQKLKVARTLTAPTEKDLPTMVNIAAELGLTIFDTTILEQLKASADANFLRLCGEHLHASRSSLVKLADDELLVRRIITDLLSTAVSKVDFYEKLPPGLVARHESLALSFLESCLALGREDYAELVVTKLSDLTGLADEEARHRAEDVLTHFLVRLERLLEAHPTAKPLTGLRPLVTLAVRLFLDVKDAQSESLRGHDKSIIMVFVRLGGGPALLSSTILPELKMLPFEEWGWKALLDDLLARRSETVFQADGGVLVSEVIADVVEVYATKASMPKADSLPESWSGAKKIVDMLKVCFASNNPQLAPTVIDRALDPKLLTPDYITNVLVPLVSELRQFIKWQGIPPTSEPYKTAFLGILRVWKERVLGPEPPASPQMDIIEEHYFCHCDPCAEIRQFLLGYRHMTHTVDDIGAAQRKHVQSKLRKYVTGAARWEMTDSFPPRLIITKQESFWKPLKWKDDQARGLRMIRTISSNDEELQLILGDLFVPLMSILTGQIMPPVRVPLISDPPQPTLLPAPASWSVPTKVPSTGSGASAADPYNSNTCKSPELSLEEAASLANLPPTLPSPQSRKRKHCDESVDVCSP